MLRIRSNGIHPNIESNWMMIFEKLFALAIERPWNKPIIPLQPKSTNPYEHENLQSIHPNDHKRHHLHTRHAWVTTRCSIKVKCSPINRSSPSNRNSSFPWTAIDEVRGRWGIENFDNFPMSFKDKIKGHKLRPTKHLAFLHFHNHQTVQTRTRQWINVRSKPSSQWQWAESILLNSRT